jgi:hypothetical protein
LTRKFIYAFVMAGLDPAIGIFLAKSTHGVVAGGHRQHDGYHLNARSRRHHELLATMSSQA